MAGLVNDRIDCVLAMATSRPRRSGSLPCCRYFQICETNNATNGLVHFISFKCFFVGRLVSLFNIFLFLRELGRNSQSLM
jgi:hypothetical protein